MRSLGLLAQNNFWNGHPTGTVADDAPIAVTLRSRSLDKGQRRRAFFDSALSMSTGRPLTAAQRAGCMSVVFETTGYLYVCRGCTICPCDFPLLNCDCDLHGVLDHTRIRRSSHADHIARRLPAAAAAATGDLEQHQQGEQEKAAGCPISMSLFSACHRNQANHRQGKQHCNIERAEGARHGRHQHGQSSRIDRKRRSSRTRTRCHRSG
jgi:hypothetical protein